MSEHEARYSNVLVVPKSTPIILYLGNGSSPPESVPRILKKYPAFQVAASYDTEGTVLAPSWLWPVKLLQSTII